ncbi:MAG: aminotransferase class IV [Bdellovibrionaceae bacterium]|nr:aminotransferase class IV [Pseudobdellovibrionaceae bacterium]
MEILSKEAWLSKIASKTHSSRNSYRAMYSTWWDGIVTDPNLMMIPVDDHQVHRGDAVFEALKVMNGRIYLAREHLDRLDRSGAAISLKNPFSREQTEEILQETLKASGLENAILRLFLGRGPGSFSTNPYDSVGAQLHLIVTDLRLYSAAEVQAGVSLALSKIPPKEPWLAQIKSCNYLANVLMKKEAVDAGVDFTVGLDVDGFLTEGSTENLILYSKEGKLLRPRKPRILAGTMMTRAFELSESIPQILSREERDLNLTDLKEAREVMMVGTTLDVLSVTKFEGQSIGGGTQGPLSKALRDLLHEDQTSS